MILAAASGRRSPVQLLGVRPIQHVGDTSYSIYLWHWPLIVLWPYAFGDHAPLPIVVASIGLATASKVLVEDAFRFAPSFQPLVPTFRFAAIGMVVLALLGGGLRFEAQLGVDAAVASAASLDDLTDEGLDDLVWEESVSRLRLRLRHGPAASEQPA